MAILKFLSVLLIALLITVSSSARILVEEDTPLGPTTTSATAAGGSQVSGGTPGSGGGSSLGGGSQISGGIPVSGGSALGGGSQVNGGTPVSGGAPISGGSSVAGGSPAAGGAAATNDPDHALIFFLHDILGGSNPTARAVTGIVANPIANGQLPFAKPNVANLPLNNGVPQNNNNNGLINNNNVPLLTGLGGNTASAIQNTGNNNNGGSGFPILNGGQFSSGTSLQQLMFGTLTVIDDELTEGHELRSGLMGKAQGFYIGSSEDGSSQTMAFTAMFKYGGYKDSISFFGIHKMASSESQVAVMGGTGKYVNAKGFAVVKTFSNLNQQETDGSDTVLQFTVYLTY